MEDLTELNRHQKATSRTEPAATIMASAVSRSASPTAISEGEKTVGEGVLESNGFRMTLTEVNFSGSEAVPVLCPTERGMAEQPTATTTPTTTLNGGRGDAV